MHLSPNEDALARLHELGLVPADGTVRLHLGCGEIRLDGYVNIDFDSSAHSVQQHAGADIFADVTKLNFPDCTIDQIRLHHVFEHFDRPTALGLLCRWHRFLKVGGHLVIETPDLEESINLLQSSTFTYQQKQVVIRHLFGSHEASWAVHWDGWYKEKYEHILAHLGYRVVGVYPSQWQMTRNVTVIAAKQHEVSIDVLKQAAKSLLHESCVDDSHGEQRLLSVWSRSFEQTVDHAPDAAPPLQESRGDILDMQAGPTVAIFMPVFNRERYIGETIDSILAQTYRNFELIIVDDGSSDSSVMIAREYAARDTRIRLVQSSHKGEVSARNEALKHISPSVRYLMNHDSDDLSHPAKLASLVAHLERETEVDIVGCYAEYFDDSGKFLGVPSLHCDIEHIAASFREVNSMVNSATLIRREVFERLGGYREEFRSVDDYDFFARALKSGYRLENLPQVLHKVRLHGESIGSTKAEQQKLLAERIIAELPSSADREAERYSILITCPEYFVQSSGAVRRMAESLAELGNHVVVTVGARPDGESRTEAGVHIMGFDVEGSIADRIEGPDAERYQAFVRAYPSDIMINVGLGVWSTDLAFLPLASRRGEATTILIPGDDGFEVVGARYPKRRDEYDHVLAQVLPLYSAILHSSSGAASLRYAARWPQLKNVIFPAPLGKENPAVPLNALIRALRGQASGRHMQAVS